MVLDWTRATRLTPWERQVTRGEATECKNEVWLAAGGVLVQLPEWQGLHRHTRLLGRQARCPFCRCTSSALGSAGVSPAAGAGWKATLPGAIHWRLVRRQPPCPLLTWAGLTHLKPSIREAVNERHTPSLPRSALSKPVSAPTSALTRSIHCSISLRSTSRPSLCRRRKVTFPMFKGVAPVRQFLIRQV